MSLNLCARSANRIRVGFRLSISGIPRPCFRCSIRYASTRSTLVGRSGKVYEFDGPVPKRGREVVASSGDERFVIEGVSKKQYRTARLFERDFNAEKGGVSKALRLHCDSCDESGVLLYPERFKSGGTGSAKRTPGDAESSPESLNRETLFDFVLPNADLGLAQRKKILRSVGEAVRDVHRKGWVFVDLRPQNVTLTWTHDDTGAKVITDVFLRYSSAARKPPDGEPFETEFLVGDPMFRSPEGQAGVSLSQASDMFCFGLMALFTLNFFPRILLQPAQSPAQAAHRREHGIENEVLGLHFLNFGPTLPPYLLALLQDPDDVEIFTTVADLARQMLEQRPELRFGIGGWGTELGTRGLEAVDGCTKLDPRERWGIERVLGCGWLEGGGSEEEMGREGGRPAGGSKG